ncbi:hypothetical protein EYF80_057987 [Liparis tanakae]|uniref:Uncharacterized protein n=1 Tax=Liparis tanakae TaxID=230148 RepID=A0A4Z2EU01_9TELE|nr:hypothetical protein EYF80_057987 [Liparis tanakae]
MMELIGSSSGPMGLTSVYNLVDVESREEKQRTRIGFIGQQKSPRRSHKGQISSDWKRSLLCLVSLALIKTSEVVWIWTSCVVCLHLFLSTSCDCLPCP